MKGEIISTRTVMKKIAKDRKVIPDPIDDRKFQENNGSTEKCDVMVMGFHRDYQQLSNYKIRKFLWDNQVPVPPLHFHSLSLPFLSLAELGER